MFRDVITKPDINSNDSLIELIGNIKKIEFIASNEWLLKFREYKTSKSCNKQYDEINMPNIDPLKTFPLTTSLNISLS